MNIYVITRTAAGYGELETAVVRASDENAARLAVLVHNAGMPGVGDFANSRYSTANLITDAGDEGVIAQMFSAS